MDTPVLVEPVAGNGYRATGTAGLLFGLTAEAESPEEAVRKVRALAEQRRTTGARLVPGEAPAGPHPFSKYAGSLRDEPLLDAWKQAMEEHRRRLDEDPDAL
ncbi:MAG TPA: hypothetical protein VFW33_07350 [Gemmataceae bacterium]|nr:hypothetical protein [Gemmataceae bacterium]